MKTKLDRREFLALSAAAGLAGCVTTPSATKWTGTDKVRALLLHLGHNMWCEWLPDDVQATINERFRPDDTLRNKDELWRRVVDRMAKRGLNMLVIDVGEGFEYPSHPELAIKGSWSPDKLRDEVVRLRGMGIEAIPKLNFSATHDGWLKHYHRMLTLPKYYEVVKDVIRDVAEVFQTPRFFHLGYDEETVTGTTTSASAGSTSPRTRRPTASASRSSGTSRRPASTRSRAARTGQGTSGAGRRSAPMT